MQKYTAYFEANSQQELYDAMVASIGGAVQSRILGGASLAPGAITVSPAAANVGNAPKKRGRKPGTKMGPYKNKKGDTHESQESNDGENSAEETEDDIEENESDEVSEVAPLAAAAAPETVAAKVYTIDDAVQALKMVNSKKNVDAARAALEHFGVKRCGELTDANRGAFVNHCTAICQ